MIWIKMNKREDRIIQYEDRIIIDKFLINRARLYNRVWDIKPYRVIVIANTPIKSGTRLLINKRIMSTR